MSTYREFRAQSYRRRRRRKLQRFGLILLIALLLCALAWFIVRIIEGPAEADSSSSETSLSQPASDSTQSSSQPSSQPESSSQQTPSISQSELWSTVENPEQTINTAGIISASAKMLSLPENGKVSLSYFDDAVFFGDSITTGWRSYTSDTGLPNAKVVAEISVSPPANGEVWQTSKDAEPYDPIVQVYSYRPKKIYMMFGTNVLVNETAAAEDKLVSDYAAVIDLLRERLPDVEIYVQSILYPTAKGVESRPGLNPERISRVNDRLAAMAVQKGCYYLDLASYLCRDNVLNYDIAQPDGIHVVPDGYRAWVDYLQRHTVYRNDSEFIETATQGQESAIPAKNPDTRWDEEAQRQAEWEAAESAAAQPPAASSAPAASQAASTPAA